MRRLLYWCGLLPVVTVNAQNDPTIQQWQLSHPSIQLISAARYAAFTEEERSLIGPDYMLFTDRITLQQLETSEPRLKSATAYNEEQLAGEDAQFIKEWRTANPDIKIIRQSEYQQFTAGEQQIYVTHHSLILTGEVITRSDIEHFN